MSTVRKIRYLNSDSFVRISSIKTRLRRRSGPGEPLLLINGMGACLESWEPLTTRLPGYDIVAVDHPGMGLSSPPNRILTMPELAEFYVSVLDYLDWPHAHVLGFSFGGTVAQQLAIDFPAYVDSLILAGTAPGLGGFPPDLLTLMTAANPLRYQIPLVRQMAAPIIYRGRVGRHPRLFETELSGWYAHRAPLLGVGAQVAAFMGWSSLAWLGQLRMPTLVLGGEEDPMAPVSNSRLIASVVPGAELRIYKKAGHLFLFDVPDQPARHIVDFLQRNSIHVAA